jgi:hypothetical protein
LEVSPSVCDAETGDYQVNSKNKTPLRYLICDILASQVDSFASDLKNAGYLANTFSTKRTALREFINWRRSR